MGIKNITVCLNCGKTEEKQNTAGKYCSNKCQQSYQSKLKIEQWLAEGNWYFANKQLSGWIKRYIRERDRNCTICGINEWNGLPITLEVDHIDGDYSNNNEKNLRAICPNCHSQTDTYKNRNFGNGRKKRKCRHSSVGRAVAL